MRDYPAVKRLSLVLAGLAAAVAGLCAVAVGDDWPIYRGAAHNGISAETGWFAPGAQLKVLWSADIGPSCSAMTVVGDRAYTMGNKADNDIVYCFDAATGKEAWKFSYPEKLDPENYEGGPNATPTVDGKCVYTVSKTGKLFCLDAEKSTKIWEVRLASKKPTWGYAGSVLPLGDKLIVNAGDHGMKRPPARSSGTAARGRAGIPPPCLMSETERRWSRCSRPRAPWPSTPPTARSSGGTRGRPATTSTPPTL